MPAINNNNRKFLKFCTTSKFNGRKRWKDSSNPLETYKVHLTYFVSCLHVSNRFQLFRKFENFCTTNKKEIVKFNGKQLRILGIDKRFGRLFMSCPLLDSSMIPLKYSHNSCQHRQFIFLYYIRKDCPLAVCCLQILALL